MSKLTLTLTQAKAICEAALAKGAELGLKPLCVVVLDGGGHLIAAQRQDGASNLRPQIALSKAAGALGLGVSSRKIAEMASERPAFVASLSALAPHGLTPAAGGVIVVGPDGDTIGAIGCSGDTSKTTRCACWPALRRRDSPLKPNKRERPFTFASNRAESVLGDTRWLFESPHDSFLGASVAARFRRRPATG